VVPAAAFDPAQPAIDAYALPDDEGRPYLAPTQLLQELVALGGGAATIVAGSPIDVPAALPVVEIATFAERGVGAGRDLLLWTHLPVPVVFGSTVDVSRNGGAPLAMTIQAAGTPNLFRIQPAGGPLTDGELLELRLDLTRIQVRDAAAGVDVPVDRWLASNGVQVAGRVGDVVRLFHTMSATPPQPDPVPPPVPQKPVRKLVTASPVRIDGELPGIELWFHVDKAVPVDEVRVKALDPQDESVAVFAEVETRTTTPVPVPVLDITSPQHNVFQLRLDTETWKRRARNSPYLRVRLQLDRIGLDNGPDLVAWADDLGIVWEDGQEDGRAVGLWVRMAELG
jgi:hypothetical protein